jgi:hypothetical protein
MNAFSAKRTRKPDEMDKRPKAPDHLEPLPRRLYEIRAGIGAASGRFSDSQARRKIRRFSTRPSSRSLRRPVTFELSVLLTAAGQSRIRTGFPSRRPVAGTPPASDAQHIVQLGGCQSKCCRQVAARIKAHEINSPHPNDELDPRATVLLTSVRSETARRGAVSQWSRSKNCGRPVRDCFSRAARKWPHLS